MMRESVAVKKMMVFVAVFALVLVAGIAVAYVATPGGGDDEAATAETTTTTVEKAQDTVDDSEKRLESEGDSEHEKVEPRSEHSDEPEEGPSEPEKDTIAPHIEILFPEDGERFEETHIAFEGVAEPGSKVFAGDYQADVDAQGNWRIVLILSKGGNTTTIKAIDAAGNVGSDKVQVYYDAPEKEEPKENHEFTAHQKYGSCSESPPYDVWHGTGAPGTKIVVASDYGSEDTVIGDKGKWDLKVVFKEAPCGKTFKVVLETNAGHRKVYEFTRICEDGGDHEESGGDK